MATTVILGAGIIGVSTAYYLSQHQPGSSIHLVDSSSSLFSSASGFAGGFVAKDWFSRSVAELGVLSYEEHRQLAEHLNGRARWGYSETVTLSHELGHCEIVGKAGVAASHTGEAQSPKWFRREDGDSMTVMDDGAGTAILDPLKLCQALMEECKQAGVHVHHPATALSVDTDMRGELATVVVGYNDSPEELKIPATRLLITAGAWTPRVFQSLFRDAPTAIPVSPYAGHSLVVRSPVAMDGESHCVYTSHETLSPEIFSRSNGVLYLAGVNSTELPLPQLATDATPDPAAIDELMALADKYIQMETALEVVRTGLCFRPVTSRGTPILTRLSDNHLGGGMSTRQDADGGVFIATGHGPWGISLSLGTGKVMAEMMQGRKLSADIGQLGLD